MLDLLVLVSRASSRAITQVTVAVSQSEEGLQGGFVFPVASQSSPIPGRVFSS
jgi:hypothetical protein